MNYLLDSLIISILSSKKTIESSINNKFMLGQLLTFYWESLMNKIEYIKDMFYMNQSV